MTDATFKQAEQRVGMVARKWTLDRLLDVGGMAAVYVATHRNGNRVAIKVMHKRYAEDPDTKERFLREGYVANKVGHPGAVVVQDDDELDDGTPFLVMELLDGQSLEGHLDKGQLTVSQGLFVADQVLEVLAAAHRQEIIHRDIKPANLFVTSAGQIKVLDFGLARVRQGISKETKNGIVVGTASYMSPEQARGKRDLIDHRTDLFAVGAVLFKSFTGQSLHPQKNPMDRVISAMTNAAPSLATVRPDLRADIVALLDRALAFQKTDRFPDADSMRAAIAQVRARDAQEAPVSRATPLRSDTPPRPAHDAEVQVSVTFEPMATGESIVVDLEDDTGEAGRYELRRRPGSVPPAGADDERLSEVTALELEPPHRR